MPNHGDELDQVFRALGDPTRRAIVSRLVRSPLTVSEIAQPLSMALPSVLQHLRVLEDCGLIGTRKLGRVRTCSIEPARLRVAETWLVDQRTGWEQRLDRLDDYLGAAAPPQHDDGKDES
jgi:DNA-binding transcriptional ArsR family regulator